MQKDFHAYLSVKFTYLGCSPDQMGHRAREVIFSSLQDLVVRINSPDLDVETEGILVLQNTGTRSPRGILETGYLPIPKKSAKAVGKDMVKI